MANENELPTQEQAMEQAKAITIEVKGEFTEIKTTTTETVNTAEYLATKEAELADMIEQKYKYINACDAKIEALEAEIEKLKKK